MIHIRLPLSRERLITQVPGESMVNAGFGNETDVNAIVARFTRTGQLPPPTSTPQYADVTELQRDFTELVEESRELQAAIAEYQNTLDKAKREETQNALNENAQLREQLSQLQDTPPDPSP